MTSASIYHRSLHDRQFRDLLKGSGALKRLNMIQQCPPKYLEDRPDGQALPSQAGAVAGQEAPRAPQGQNLAPHLS